MDEEQKKLLEAVSKGVEPLANQVKTQGETLEGQVATLKGIDERLQKIEKLPLEKHFSINAIPQVHRGYKLSRQAQYIRNNSKMFEILKDEQKVDEFCKFMIDVIQRTTTNETTAAQGGYLVPDEFQWDIIQLARNMSYALRICKVFGMSSDNLYLPAELTLPSVAWKDESAQLSQSDPTFDQVNLVAKKLTAYSGATNELLKDSAIDIVGLLTEQFAYGIGLELDNQVLNGTGSPVSGVGTAKAGYSVICSAGASMSTVAFGDLSNMISKIQQGYLNGSRFLVGRMALHYVRSMKDTTGQPITIAPMGVQNGSIYGFPYDMTEKIANTDGANKLMAVLGNFNYFYIGRREGAMVIEANPYSRFDYDETFFRMVTRWGLAVAQSNAFVRLLTAAA